MGRLRERRQDAAQQCRGHQRQRALVKLAAIEQSEGKQARYHVEALMIQAKRVLRAEDAAKPDVGAITAALTELKGTKPPKSFPARRQRQDRLPVHEQRQVVPHHSQAADAPYP
ncbi:MAG: DUF3829 domain-containing protein [Pseudolabrys sp.]